MRQFRGDRALQRHAPRTSQRLRRARLAGQRARAAQRDRARLRAQPRRRLELDDALGRAARRRRRRRAAASDIDLPFKEAKAQLVERFEREYIEDLLKRHEGNLSAAAREAEIDRKHLRELLRKHGLRESGDT